MIRIELPAHLRTLAQVEREVTVVPDGPDVITLPSYIKNVAKVQIYCAWAEAVLGEASFGGKVDTE